MTPLQPAVASTPFSLWLAVIVLVVVVALVVALYAWRSWRRGALVLVLLCALATGGCVDAIILGAIWWDCGFMAMSFDNCRSIKGRNLPARVPVFPDIPATATCDREEFHMAWTEWETPTTPWSPEPARVALREQEWLRYRRAAEACGVDWRSP